MIFLIDVHDTQWYGQDYVYGRRADNVNQIYHIHLSWAVPLPTTKRLKVSRKCLKVSYTVLKVITRDNDRLKTS